MNFQLSGVTRRRSRYGVLILMVVILGLSTRRLPHLFPALVVEYGGDTLWALNVFLVLGFLFPRLPTLRVAALALGISFAVEFSQFYHAPWIDAVRDTPLGGLLLGYDFLWSDLVCYTVGVGMGVIGETAYFVLRIS
ncbi:MAG: DUF2809 domain-containing protein [Calditrichaeota bacterium]|nr:MAG: DUF2809 domain-containing protein [Calditrichota bacterium]